MPEFEVVERNLRQAMRTYAHATEEGEVRELPGLSVVSSGLPLGVFNSAMLNGPFAGTDDALEQTFLLAGVHFAARGLPWSFWLCEELLSGAQRKRALRFFSERGFRIAQEPSGMYTEHLAPPRHRLPVLECRPIQDQNTRLAFCDVTSIVFDIPFLTSRQIYDREVVWRGAVRGYVGYLAGKAVTTAMLVDTAEARGVYSVGTLPQHQRQGFGEALLRKVLAGPVTDGRPLPMALQSTRAGLRLYEKLGFRAVAKFTVYVSG